MGLTRQEREANAHINRSKAVIPWGDLPHCAMRRELILRSRKDEKTSAYSRYAHGLGGWDADCLDDRPSDGGNAA
jgi:hypothetical protein